MRETGAGPFNLFTHESHQTGSGAGADSMIRLHMNGPETDLQAVGSKMITYLSPEISWQ